MFWKSFVAAVLSVVVVAVPVRGDGAPMDPDTLSAALDTAHPDEVAYITYAVALVDLGVLSKDLVGGSFEWARRKPYRRKKFQYFKHAVIERASRTGVTMPPGTPDLTPTIQGRVVTRVLMVDIPVAGALVRIRDTTRETTTDLRGNFTFADMPYGRYTIDATAVVILKGSATATLPNPVPPATDPGFVTLRVE